MDEINRGEKGELRYETRDMLKTGARKRKSRSKSELAGMSLHLYIIPDEVLKPTHSL